MREEEFDQVEVDVWKYIFAFIDAAVIKCGIELGIADALENHEGPMTLSELSSALGCEPSCLYRIMRFLVHNHIFKEEPTSQGTKGYVQTPLSRRLMGSGENSMAPLLLLESSPVMLAPWHGLSARVLARGNAPFVATHGADVWNYAAANAGHSKLINEAMACEARSSVPAIFDCCPEVFDGLRSLVDVGGGNGATLRVVVKARPQIRGINFDLPHVVSVAPNCGGIENVGGNMFDCVPKADAAFLKWVLHDWADDECILILKNCREAIPQENGKVIIFDAVINEENQKDEKLGFVKLMLDMVMMAHTTKGKERTLKEWDYVLREAGFSRYTVKHIRAVQSVIEAYP